MEKCVKGFINGFSLVVCYEGGNGGKGEFLVNVVTAHTLVLIFEQMMVH